jgi:serine/threonine protein kinase/lipopolysaccharide biosynthesis regulator YciM
MTDTNTHIIEELFQQAMDRPADERIEFLREAAPSEQVRCEVELLLKYEQETDDAFLSGSGQRATISETMPERIGPYTIKEELGRGGMGIVYLADQDSPRRSVALKVIRPEFASSKMLRRFEFEAHVLGQLNHPAIAQIHEAGTVETDFGPRPFLAMELLDGEPLITYAKRRQLSLRGRLELAARICDGVEHAHQKGVIHRDLKPANIIVVEQTGVREKSNAEHVGQPKILDFGVARATNSDVNAVTLQTDVGQLIGTVPYMSPEQLSGEPDMVDTRSDVYAIGVMIYELITGKLPHDVRDQPLPDAIRNIIEHEPPSISALDSHCRGDIDTMVRHAMEKDPNHRYPSASALGADIRRFLADEPISARRPSFSYQLAKYARRHRALVASAAAIFLALVVGSGFALFGLFEARRERDAARLARDESDSVTRFLTGVLEQVKPGEMGREVPLRDVLDEAAAVLSSAENEHPLIVARLQHTIGTTYQQLGLLNEAVDHLTQAVALRQAELGDDHRQTLDSRHNLAVALLDLNDIDRAEEIALDVYRRRRALFPSDHPDLAISQLSLGRIHRERGRYSEAMALIDMALEMRRSRFGDRHPDTLSATNSKAACLSDAGEVEQAVEIYEFVYDAEAGLLAENDPAILITRNNLAGCYTMLGRLTEAEVLYETNLKITREVLGESHPRTILALNNLAHHRTAQSRYEEAISMMQEALALHRRQFGADHAGEILLLANLGNGYRAIQQYEMAEEYLTHAIELQRKLGMGRHPSAITYLNNLAVVYKQQDRPEESVTILKELMSLSSELLGPEHPKTWGVEANLGELYRKLGRLDDALQILQRVHRRAESEYGRLHSRTISMGANLAATLNGLGRLEEAAAIIEMVAGDAVAHLGAEHQLTLSLRKKFGDALVEVGRSEEGATILEETLEQLRDVVGAEHIHVIASEFNLGLLYHSLERYDEAEPLLRHAVDTLRTENRSGGMTMARTLFLWSDVQRNRGLQDEAGSGFAELIQLLANDDSDDGRMLAARASVGRYACVPNDSSAAEASAAIEEIERIVGADHPVTDNARVLLETTRRKQQNNSEPAEQETLSVGNEE